MPKHNQTYHYKDSFDEIEKEFAKELFIEKMHRTHPDAINNAKEMFWKANEYWRNNMDKTDLLAVDGTIVPGVSEKPDFAKPFQVVRYNGEIYYSDEMGVFMRKNDYLKLGKMTKKELAAELGVRNSQNSKSELIRKVYEQRESFRDDPGIRQFHKAKQMDKSELRNALTDTGIAESQIIKLNKRELVMIYANRTDYINKTQKANEIVKLKKRRTGLHIEKMSRALSEHKKSKIEAEIEAINSEIAYFHAAKANNREQLESEIETYKKLRKDPKNTETRNKELDGMIRAREYELSI